MLARACLLDHGDVLVLDGQCQEEFLHCADPGLEQERINVTFRWIRQHVASCLFVRTGVACCVRKVHPSLLRSLWRMALFGGFWVLQGALCMWEVLALQVYASCVQGSGYAGVPIDRHAPRAEVGGGIICVACWEFAGLHISTPFISWRLDVVPLV